MSQPGRRAKKIDGNQNDIVGRLRKLEGVSVECDHDDIICGHDGRNFWFEIKDIGAYSKRDGKLLASHIEKSQRILLGTWCGHYSIVGSYEEIVAEIGYTGDK